MIVFKGVSMNKIYTKSEFEKDLETLKKMKISEDSKIDKGNALSALYFNQDNDKMVDKFAIADMRENILKEDK